MTQRRTCIFRILACATVGVVVASACGSAGGVRIARSDATDVVNTTTPDTTTPDITPPDTNPSDTNPAVTDPPNTATLDTTTATTIDMPTQMNLPGTDVPLDGPYPFDANKPPQPFDGLMVATVHDLEQFWAEQMPAVFGQDYVPLALGVFPAYPERTDYPPNECLSSYSDVQDNGFYCPDNDFITWDDPGYAAQGYADHGSGAITGLMSHEWGHAIQARTGVFDIVPELSTPIVELQADCYSGAWFAHIARGESTLLSFTDADIRSGLLDTALSADPVGSSPADDGAHGAGFDRVGAFQDGFNLGVAQCAGYPQHNPPITEFPFDTSYAGAQDPGNEPYAGLLLDIPTDLNTYWTQTLPDSFTPLTIAPFTGEPPVCDGLTAAAIKQTLAVYCASTGNVLVNDEAAHAAVNRIGDFAAGYFLAQAWAEAAQISVASKLSGVKRVLYDDCFVGVWAKSLPTNNTGPADRLLEISPGDLDEAIATAILLADDSAAVGVNGDAYAKVDAFRHGALGGISGCNTFFS